MPPYGSFLLNAFEPDGHRFVLLECQSQSFTRNRLLDFQIFKGMGDRGWPYHLVSDSISKVAFVDLHW